MNRREALQLAALAPFAAALRVTEVEAAAAADHAVAVRRKEIASQTAYEPKFFTPHEWATVGILVDMILPADERGGSATQAGVPEFMDFVMTDQPNRQDAMRGGLAWIDAEMRRRYGKTFVAASDGERRGLLDLIAYPKRAPKEVSHGVSFFNSFRDLTASGYFSSKMGVEDLKFMGNTYVAEWKGCPPEALARLGVSYDD